MSSTYSVYTDSSTNFKVVVVGERAVGKTSLALRYVKGVFSKHYAVTVGIEFYSKMIKNDQETYNLQLWDTAGQECFHALVKSFYNQASCVIIAYSDPLQMRRSINCYLQKIDENTSTQTAVFVVRTKLDLKPLTDQEIDFLGELTDRHKIVNWMTLSSKDGVNIQQFFLMVSKYLIQKYKINQEFRQLVDAKKLSDSICLSRMSTTDSKRRSLTRKQCCNA